MLDASAESKFGLGNFQDRRIANKWQPLDTHTLLSSSLDLFQEVLKVAFKQSQRSCPDFMTWTWNIESLFNTQTHGRYNKIFFIKILFKFRFYTLMYSVTVFALYCGIYDGPESSTHCDLRKTHANRQNTTQLRNHFHQFDTHMRQHLENAMQIHKRAAKQKCCIIHKKHKKEDTKKWWTQLDMTLLYICLWL